MRLLQQIIEPQRLMLVWQTLENTVPECGGTGKRYIVGQFSIKDTHIKLHYFLESSDFHDALALGFKGYANFDISQKIQDIQGMNTLQRRLPSRQRTDFDDFLRYHRINPDQGRQMSDFALLGYTGGKLPGDSFSFVHTFEEAFLPCELTIEVAGFRHYAHAFPNLQELVSQPVKFKPETGNAFDSEAVAIQLANGAIIGYVNRAQRDSFHKWIGSNCLEGAVERVDDNPTRPGVLLFVNVHAGLFQGN